MATYYNEIDPFCAEWLRNLIKAGHIADGDVDKRDIRDVTPKELMGYTQCHFFAGIGGWSYALRLAGWPDDRPVWTGSCPCQSFSAAGRGKGFADERHLWPYWFHLIRVCRPPVIFGEQVASKLALSWLDLVFDDLEAEGYTCGAADLPACSVGAPHIRQRLWFVGTLENTVREGSSSIRREISAKQSNEESAADTVSAPSPTGLLGHAETGGCEGNILHPIQERWDREGEESSVARSGAVGALADSLSPGVTGGDKRGLGEARREVDEQKDGADLADEPRNGCEDAGELADSKLFRCGNTSESFKGSEAEAVEAGRREGNSPDNNRFVSEGCDLESNFWSSCLWLPCRDGKWRPTQPGIFPLAHGISARVGRLRAYGNAICPQIAAEFIKGIG